MNTRKEFERMMESQKEIALATSVNDESNVRIVNFIYDDTLQTLYFATFSNNDKVTEMEQNNNVSFTTIPHKGYEHIKAKAKARKSNLSIFDLKDRFSAKIPEYQEMIDQAGQFLILYEVKFDTAVVVLDFENIDKLTLVSHS